jgi:hypothetical protein
VTRSKVHLPDEEKTIKPVAIGGLAGGLKYIVQGILYDSFHPTANKYGSQSRVVT